MKSRIRLWSYIDKLLLLSSFYSNDLKNWHYFFINGSHLRDILNFFNFLKMKKTKLTNVFGSFFHVLSFDINECYSLSLSTLLIINEISLTPVNSRRFIILDQLNIYEYLELNAWIAPPKRIYVRKNEI